MTVFDKVSQAAIMKMIVEKCLRAKEENNNRMPWGFTSQLVSEYGDTFSFLSPIYIRVAVHRAEQKKKEELKKKMASSPIPASVYTSCKDNTDPFPSDMSSLGNVSSLVHTAGLSDSETDRTAICWPWRLLHERRCRAAKKRYVDLSLALFYCLSCVVKKVESGTCTCTCTSTYLYNYKYL